MSSRQTINASKTRLVDNPCWGSQGACSLTKLLQKVDKERLILHESDDFVFLNKPPDLRMDGPHAASVLKLLMYFYPTKYLRSEFGDASSFNERLLQAIEADIHVHGDAAALARSKQPDVEVDKDDVPPRPCHQLDYATSGVLWVARNSAAANLARQAFETRTGVSKTYTAVVHGHVAVDPTWPIKSQKEMKDWLETAELTYRRERRKRRPDTFDGFMPPHSLFQMYKTQQQRQGASGSKSKKRRKKETVELTAKDWENIWESLNEYLAQEPDARRLVEMDWKTARREFPGMLAGFKEASKAYNQILREGNKANAAASHTEFPLIFRVREELDSNTFYINAPLGQLSNEFAMHLPPSLREQVTETRLQTGPSDLDYKPSLTRCTVLEQDSVNTKVSLQPQTGRRHQLRVHMALLRHAIVGDATYSPSSLHQRTGRMCLHAYELDIDLEGKQKLKFQAPDPFRLDPESNAFAVEEF